MKARHLIDTHRPLQGRSAFVRAVEAMALSTGACSAVMALPGRAYVLDRDEDRTHPGEGSA